MEKKEKKKKSIFGKICSIIVDILIIPVIILAFACTIFTFSAKSNNKVPQIFGKSIVTVVSNSMEPEFSVGDVLIISKINDLNSLKVGDNIAFYAPSFLTSNMFTTELENGERVSKVIYHQIVDIIYPQNANGTKAGRHFVCMGTNVGEREYYEVEAGTGKYKLENEQYVPAYDGQGGYNGDYDIVLKSLTPDTNQSNVTTGDIEASEMATMQYVTDNLVVGMYSSSLSPAISGFINFSSSTTGLLCLVIVPAGVMLVFVIINMVKEIKASKKEEAEEQLVLEGNFSKLKETSNAVKEETLKKEQATAKNVPVASETPKEEDVDLNTIISSVSTQKTEDGNLKTAKVAEQAKDADVTNSNVSKPKAVPKKVAKTSTTATTETKATTTETIDATTTSFATEAKTATTKPAVKKPVSTEAKSAIKKPTTPKAIAKTETASAEVKKTSAVKSAPVKKPTVSATEEKVSAEAKSSTNAKTNTQVKSAPVKKPTTPKAPPKQ